MIEPFSLPLSAPLATANGNIERRDGFLVGYDHRGVTGLGESTVLPGWTESLDECRQALDRALDAGVEDHHSRALLTMDADEVPAARCGFATALVDADARADGIPLYRWFDPDSHSRQVPVNATVGDGDEEVTAAAAESAVGEGFGCLKVKVAARDLARDVGRLRAVRKAVGPDLTLRADANGAWDRETARRALDEFAALDVAYVEQPLPGDDLDGLADLRGGPVDIAVDESLVEHRVADVLDAKAADVLVLKPMVLGGPGNAHTVAIRARELGIDPVVTTTVDAVVARAAAVHVAAAIPDIRPCGLATAGLLDDDLGPDPAPVANGSITVPQDPGLGIELADLEVPE